ncbi:hypothetical protein PY254_14605 [Rhodanobacter sp. AS-Z3]|uniref:hypothetical protein n=1 Tax=Rhodanobacter sp. AS-Z3 TaxID=3031330 RepID=UPI0024797429|nr:hypothetical protein [Rhodanobacter sp. AS-Z3]WEN14451.1 hypothetical protein PY254_14605 [Rhodanobacter sp. AS-Z3]
MKIERSYWFPAKRYGWGWGLPTRWQGWVCFAIYAGGISLVMHFFRPVREPGLFTLGIVLLTLGLIAVCWLKGEPPGRRGND